MMAGWAAYCDKESGGNLHLTLIRQVRIAVPNCLVCLAVKLLLARLLMISLVIIALENDGRARRMVGAEFSSLHDAG